MTTLSCIAALRRASTFRTATILLAITVLSGCAVRYGPRIPGIQPGYVDQRLGEMTYQVRVGEAWSKDWADLEKFAMYRAAELTKNSGQRYFAVSSATTSINNYTITTPTTANTSGTVSRIGSTAFINATTTVMPGGSAAIQGGWYSLDFRILTKAELASYPNVVDSEKVMRDLRYFIDSRR